MSTFNNTRVPRGQTGRHVLMSGGGDSDLMKFYCTTNKTSYGRWWDAGGGGGGGGSGCSGSGGSTVDGCPKSAQSGFLSNNRLALYYNPRLDLLDNPSFGQSLLDNYQSVTAKSFPGHRSQAEVLNLPRDQPRPETSGFSMQAKLHIPKGHEVQAARVSISANPTSYLWKIKNKDPLGEQNNGRGADPMLSETNERFRWNRPVSTNDAGDVQSCVTVPKRSGFSSNYNSNNNSEPITFKPVAAHNSRWPPFTTDRLTGVSTMKADYLPHEFEQVGVVGVIPDINCRSSLQSGFSKNNMPMDTKTCYEDYFRKPLASCTVQAADVCQKKTPTGFTSNRRLVLPQNNDRECHVTEYAYRYIDRTPVGVDREGHTWGSVLPMKRSGFSSCAGVHGVEPLQVCQQEPYEQRSLVARDNCLDGQVAMAMT